MSEMYKCDRCSKLTYQDSSGERYATLKLTDTARQLSTFHLCPRCERLFYTDFLKWKWNTDEEQYVPSGEDKMN